MKAVKFIIVSLILIVVCSASLTSCGTAQSIQDKSSQMAGYTLKNKTELMQQKIAKKKNNIVLATP